MYIYIVYIYNLFTIILYIIKTCKNIIVYQYVFYILLLLLTVFFNNKEIICFSIIII